MNQTTFNGINGIFNQPQQSYTCYTSNSADIKLCDIMEEMIDWMLNDAIKKQAFFTLVHKLLDTKIDYDIITELCECLYGKCISKEAFMAIIKAFLSVPRYSVWCDSGTSNTIQLNNDNKNSFVYNSWSNDNQNKANSISVSPNINSIVTETANKLYSTYTNEGVGPEIFEPFDNIKLEGTKVCMGKTGSGDWYEFDIDVDPNKFKANLGPSN